MLRVLIAGGFTRGIVSPSPPIQEKIPCAVPAAPCCRARLGPPACPQQADSRLTLANYLDLEDVQNPVLSDGRQIISSPPVGG